MKIATFNVNGVNGRLPVLLRWLDEASPDVVCLQELKSPQEKFPAEAISKAGYGAIWHGQKSWNGFAILAKGADPLETRRGLPGGTDDTHSRYLEAAVNGVLVGCLYLPNGNPAPGPKFDYKLRWFDRLAKHAKSLLKQEVPVVLAGDFNVMPADLDVYKPESWRDDALFLPQVRQAFQKLLKQGWTDAIRALHPDEVIYTFWDYFRNAYARNAGLRIDHFLLSAERVHRLKAAGVDREVRGWEKASDHAPARIELSDKKLPAARKTAVNKSTSKKVAVSPLGKAETPGRRGKLGKYDEKRNFGKTPEPSGKIAQKAGASFVVQEHHARRHHFDFRLEIDGVLVSWAVPKGIPEGRASKRLAVHVEGHPLEYGSFEGEIPKGNYGAGAVAIWDKGTWEPATRTWRKDFAGGKLKFYLHGTRLQGEYLLARMDEEPNWLMRKIGDEAPPVEEELEKEEPKFIPFQLAKVVPSVPSGSDWIHELKLDGYRLMAIKRKDKVTLYTRNGHDWTDKLGTLAKRIGELSSKDFVLDGEAVVFDEKGKTSFGLLQEALGVRARKRQGVGISFVGFDLLHLDGYNLRNLPLSARLKHLDKVLTSETGSVRRSKIWDAHSGGSLFEQACKLDLEGIISKKLSQRYASDLREWTKSKCRPRQEFVVCGYTPPKSSLPAFGALVIGSYENGKLVPRGKVGTGFSDKLRETILARMKKLHSGTQVFRIEEKDVQWLKPTLVIEVEYAEITREGSVRQASFIGMREDKTPKDVHLDGLQTASSNQKGAVVSGITISNPDRMVFPGITKMEVVNYFERTAELMLPYLVNRPLALLRAPDGVNGETFFQKTFTTHQPPSVFLRSISADTEVIHIKDIKGLVALAQFGVVELHPWGSRFPDPEKPDFLIWDLDPDASVPWKEVLGAAFLLRDLLGNLGLSTMVKTSGGKGLHVQMPIRPGNDWNTLREFTKAVSSAVAALNPRRFTVMSTKSRRTGKIYIDWMRNGRGATCIAPWCLRIRPGAPVSMPVAWDDLPSLEPGGGFTIKHPPQEPADWMSPVPQRIGKSILRGFGLG